MSTSYELIDGTEPHEDARHEPRTLKRTNQDDDGNATMYMMTEIEDGVFVQWGTCRSCSKRIHACTCKTGPVMADYIAKWRDERFEKSVRHRKPSEMPSGQAETIGIDLTPVIDVVKAAAEQGVEPYDPDDPPAFDATDEEKQDLHGELDESSAPVEVIEVICQVCFEPIEQDLDDNWIHAASGEPECWTGDGSVALPPEIE